MPQILRKSLSKDELTSLANAINDRLQKLDHLKDKDSKHITEIANLQTLKVILPFAHRTSITYIAMD